MSLTEKQLEILEDMKEYTQLCPACLEKVASDFERKNRIGRTRDAKAAALKAERAHAKKN